jgi:hypothetical protein
LGEEQTVGDSGQGRNDPNNVCTYEYINRENKKE